MRVHPNVVAPKVSRWHLSAVIAAFCLLVLVTIYKATQAKPAPVMPVEKRIEVVVTHSAIEAGQAFDQAKLSLEQRPISTLPADAITSFDALKGKVSAGPIPAGYPLAMALLADPVAVVAGGKKAGAQATDDPVEAMLEEIKSDTVAVPIQFAFNAPQRGSRIAIAISNSSRRKGEILVVIEEAWVFEAEGNRAVVRVEPSKALLLQAAKNLGDLSFIEIPVEGDSPYRGSAVADVEDLKKAFGYATLEQEALAAKGTSKPVAPVERKRFKNYAWIAGSGLRYGIDEKGEMHVVDGEGLEVQPLMPRGFSDPSEEASEPEAVEPSSDQSHVPETGAWQPSPKTIPEALLEKPKEK